MPARPCKAARQPQGRSRQAAGSVRRATRAGRVGRARTPCRCKGGRRKTPPFFLQVLLQPAPVKPGAWVVLAPGRHVFMACHMGNGMAQGQVVAQGCQRAVLGCFKHVSLQPFQFNAYRIVIALRTAPVARGPCMPGALVTVHKLPQRATALHKEMGRNLHAADALKVGVRVPVELVAEKRRHLWATVPARRQADGMQHHQIDRSTRRAGTEIGRGTVPGMAVPAPLPGKRACSLLRCPGHPVCLHRGALQCSGAQCGSGSGAG